MIHLFHIVRDIFAVIGVLWLALSILGAMSDAAKAENVPMPTIEDGGGA